MQPRGDMLPISRDMCFMSSSSFDGCIEEMMRVHSRGVFKLIRLQCFVTPETSNLKGISPREACEECPTSKITFIKSLGNENIAALLYTMLLYFAFLACINSSISASGKSRAARSAARTCNWEDGDASVYYVASSL